MKRVLRLSSGLALLACFSLNAAVLAEDEQLDLARGLFEMQEYVAAHEALVEVDPDTLGEDEAKVYDELLKALPEAIRGSAKAKQDQADAKKAYDEGRWTEADQLYTRVIDNDYAQVILQTEARTQRQRIAEKLELSEAAKPTGPVPDEPEPAVQEPQPEAEQQPAEEVKPVAEPAEPIPEPTGQAAQPTPRRRTLMDDLRVRDDLLWQRAEAKMQEAINKAGEAVADRRFEEARQLAENALQLIEANRGYAQPPARYEAGREQALACKQLVAEEYDSWSRAEAERQRMSIAEQIARRRESQDQQRREKVEQLFNTASQLKAEQRFREAAEAMRQVLILDQANAKASYWLEVYEDFRSLYEQKEVDREIDRQTQRTLQEVDETRVPWAVEILYPRNWMEITARRVGIEGSGGVDEDFELNRTLDTVQPEVNFEEQPFDQVIDFLTDLNEVNIAVDWEDLASNGIDRDKPISVRLHDIKLRTVLAEVLTQVGGDVPLKFAVGEGLVRVATKEKLDRDKYILVYDIRDLMTEIPRFVYDAQIELLGSGPNGSNGAGGGIFGPRGGDLEATARKGEPNSRMANEIMDTIRQAIEPDSWRETGGGEGALRELNGQLIVYNTSEAHQQARALLSQLREARALMVMVEARYLMVGSNFLEEIGVDLDFVFNSGSAGFDPAFNTQGAAITDPFTGAQAMIPRAFSQIGLMPAIPGLGGGALGNQVTPVQPYGHPGMVPTGTGMLPSSHLMSPITLQQNSINLADPRALNTGIPGTFASQGLSPALNLAGSFLDNLQVDFLIRATQANRRSSVVQAPRVMMWNGGEAVVAVTRNRQYVSSVTPSVAEGAVGVQPVIQTAASGTRLFVRGAISADRRYVTLEVQTELADEPDFERFEVQRASGNSPGIFIMLTDQLGRTVQTMVSVPDGGTVLLGGLKQVGEIEIDAGVPILSKIPILKRAFTNTTQVKDTQTLLILLKAKILIQKEAEEEAFPTLNSLPRG
jgi:general secretion pathway protein D